MLHSYTGIGPEHFSIQLADAVVEIYAAGAVI